MVKMSGKALFYGFVTGTIIGGAITLLSTPKSGDEVQRIIRYNVGELSESLANVKDKTKELKIKFQEVTKEGTTTFKTVSSDIQQSIKEWKKDVEPTVNDIQRSIDELHQTIDQLEAEIKKPL